MIRGYGGLYFFCMVIIKMAEDEILRRWKKSNEREPSQFLATFLFSLLLSLSFSTQRLYNWSKVYSLPFSLLLSIQSIKLYSSFLTAAAHILDRSVDDVVDEIYSI